MGVDVSGVGGGDGSREKGVRHFAPVFKSPISLHKDQLSTSGDDGGSGGEEEGRGALVCSHFVPQIGRGRGENVKAFIRNFHIPSVPLPICTKVQLHV